MFHRPGPRTLRRLAHVVAAVTVLLTVATAALTVANRHVVITRGGDTADSVSLNGLVPAVAFAAAGWLLAVRRPTVIFGWLALLAGIAHAVAAFTPAWAIYSVAGGHHLPLAPGIAVAALWGSPVEPLVLVTTWALFPSGRFPRGRVRWLAYASIALCGAGWLAGPLGRALPSDVLPRFDVVHNPLQVGELPMWLAVSLFTTGLLLGSVVIIVRWRQAAGELRQVLRWLAVVNIVGILVTPLVVGLPAGELIAGVATIVELAVVVAVVLANQVYGIDVVLNRTLVYVLLTAVVVAIYAAGVGVLAALGATVGGPWTVIAAVGAAFSLAPARRRVQRGVNRFLYGERDEPYAVMGRIASRLEAAGSVQQLLPGLVEAVAGALRLPSAAVEMRGDDGAVRQVTHGVPRGATVRFPLVHQGRDLGALVVGLRSGQAALDARETGLLADIGRQVAVAVSNVLLTEELVRSRERIVTAAEEERRRLRRDLHDGLGPVLTAAATRVDAARNLVGRDLPRAKDLLGTVRRDLTTALADLRRLVYALRPPVLDELGLLGALREQLEHAALPVTLAVPDTLPALPPAVEIAAYRIVSEAVTNVARHARAAGCEVSITCTDLLTIEIRDDGAADRVWAPGVGLTSMRERATALGGTWAAGPADGGGRVLVELPLSLAGGVAPASAWAGPPSPALAGSAP